eukprot:CAMPEP_0171986278 /NCGR_PEP_ID=MMETSP0993-20121228/274789_1 /TAXON_ID=483369 /ORGANISM="non described non described, Strain CCMP2098" /LENGTH=248 /DNA_ID=CAMNT_0012639183 /DNA_START=367 /DNA_END=1113 /DNA_ORIENTATION=+
MKGKTVCSKEVKGIVCETSRTNVLQAAEQREPSVKVVAQLAAMTEEAINKSAAITIGNWWNQSGPSAQPKTKSRVAQKQAGRRWSAAKSAAITIGNWWNQSGPSAQPKTKSRVAQKQAGRRWSAAEEQAAKRTNEESPPGGGGHVASNNAGAGMVLYNCFTCHFPVAPNAQTPSMKLKVRWASAGLKYGPLFFYGFVRGMYGVCTGSGPWFAPLSVRGLLRTKPVPELRSAPLWSLRIIKSLSIYRAS